MPRWLTKVLATVHEQAAANRIRLTAKANRELRELGAGLDRDDVREILIGLAARNSVGRLASEATGEWMYVFKPG